jgi:CRISPR-associated endoribonuclease Cas6
MMLISIVLTLTPTHPGVLPPELGRAVHAATLDRIGQIAPALAEQLHAGDGPKPLTCSGLMPAVGPGQNRRHPGDSMPMRPGERYCVRVTGLVEPVSRTLVAGFLEQPPATWVLHGQPFRLIDAVCDAARHAWCGSATCEDLIASALQQAGRLPRSVTLEFASPTAFKSGGIQIPVPMPDLTFGSLVERWNAFSPLPLDPAMRGFAGESVAISRYQLESRPFPHKNGALRIGGVGQVTYTVLSDDPYALAAFTALGGFALYSGVGAQTATGMGQCRRVR